MIRESLGGLTERIRRVPQRITARLERTTGLPPGFWFVLMLAVSVAVMATAATVTALYLHINHP